MNEEEVKKLTDARDAWKQMAFLQKDLCVCYRTTNHRRADKILTEIEKVEETLRDLGEDFW